MSLNIQKQMAFPLEFVTASPRWQLEIFLFLEGRLVLMLWFISGELTGGLREQQ